MAPIKHVASRQNDGTRHDLRIIRDQKPAFAGIDVFVGLSRITANPAMPPRRHPVPGRAHRMGAILDHRDASVITNLHQPVHVADMAAHMAQEKGLRARLRRLGRQIVQIDGQRLGRLHEHRLRMHARDRAGHRGQREPVRQDLVARPHADRPQGTAHRIAARGHGQRIFRPRERGEFFLQGADLADLALGQVVAMQPAMGQHPHGGLDPGLRDRLLLREISGECLCHGREIAPPQAKGQSGSSRATSPSSASK